MAEGSSSSNSVGQLVNVDIENSAASPSANNYNKVKTDALLTYSGGGGGPPGGSPSSKLGEAAERILDAVNMNVQGGGGGAAAAAVAADSIETYQASELLFFIALRYIQSFHFCHYLVVWCMMYVMKEGDLYALTLKQRTSPVLSVP